MTEPVAALSTTSRPLDPALLPKRAKVGDAAYNATFLGCLGAGTLALAAAGAPLPVAASLGAMAAAPVTWLVDRIVLAQRATLRFNAETVPAGEATARGRLDEAERIYAALARRYRARPGLQAVALLHVAATRATRGDVDDAIAMLLAIDAFKPGKRQPLVVLRAPRLLAELYAQLGRTEEARRWLEDARARKVTVKVYDAYVEAAILAREGRYAEAALAYEREWIDLERVVSQLGMNELRVRRAFVLSRLPDRGADVDKLLAGVQPSRDDELLHVGRGWPELAAFVHERGLARA